VPLLPGKTLQSDHVALTWDINRKPVFCMLINSQNKVGRQHLLKGSFSERWTKIQGRHIKDDPELDQEKQSGC
jgi:hypothetical protein